MAEKIQGITIEIGGDASPLNKALKEINGQARSMQTELKGVNSLLKLDPSNVDLLRQKQDLLTKSVTATEDKLAKLKIAKEEADKEIANGAQINEAEYRNLTREIASTEIKIKDLKKETKDFGSVAAQQLKEASAKVGEFGDKVKGAGKAFQGVSTAAGGALAGMVGMAVKAGQSADDINTLAKQTGLSTAEIQKFKYASDLIDVPLETLTGSMAKLTKNMASAQNGSKNTQQAFDDLGISIENNDGTLRSNQEVFDAVIMRLGFIENETQRDAIAMQIFGKSAQDLNPLILGGADALAQLGQEAEDMGLILSQDALDSANAFNDELDKTKAQLGGTFGALGAEIGTLLLPILQNLVEFVQSVAENLRGMDSTTLTVILTVLALAAAIAPLLLLIGGVIGSISTIIAFIPTLQAGIAAINAVMKANVIGIVVTVLAALVLALIKAYQTNDEFRAKVDAAFNAIKDTVTKVVSAVVGKISEFIEIGANFVKGLWDGISQSTAWIIRKVKEWCGNLLGTIKSVFGIKSPSRVFRDEIGKNLALGIGEGFTDEMIGVEKDMAQTLDGLNLQSALDDLTTNATYAVTPTQNFIQEPIANPYELVANMVATALLEGLNFVGNSIFDAIPKKFDFHVNGSQMAKATWEDFAKVGAGKGKVFAPSREQMTSIAMSIKPTT